MNPSEHWKNMHKKDLDPANQKKNKMHYESVKKHAAMPQSNQASVSAKSFTNICCTLSEK